MHPQSLNMQFAFKAMLISHDRILPYGTFLSLRLVHPSHPPASGGCAYCEVVISGKKDGPFSTQLQCSIEHAAAPLLLPLQGCIQVRYVHLFTCGSQNASTCALLVCSCGDVVLLFLWRILLIEMHISLPFPPLSSLHSSPLSSPLSILTCFLLSLIPLFPSLLPVFFLLLHYSLLSHFFLPLSFLNLSSLPSVGPVFFFSLPTGPSAGCEHGQSELWPCSQRQLGNATAASQE